MQTHRTIPLTLRLLLIVWSALCGTWLHAAPEPHAQVDRAVVSEGDSLTLTVRIDAISSDDPDFSLLERDFQVFGVSRSTQRSSGGGQWTEWRVNLMPKRGGQLVIPAIAVGDQQTQPLSVQVQTAAPPVAGDASEPVFITAELDRDNVYVQQQALLTLRVFRSIQLDDMHITEPAFDNATVQKLSETSFRRDIAGTTYVVHELTYAIFPQQAGALIVPEIVFNASQPTRSRSLFDFPGQGRPLRKMTQQLQLQVKPIPPQFTGSVWLPARNLTLAESWGGSPQQVAVGESVTRSIIMRADGVRAAQLPALDLPAIDNARLYADQPNLQDEEDAAGVHGKRIESAALIATRAGPVALPETRVVWWDVDSDSEKVATLPAQTLHIKPGAAGAGTAAPVIAEPQPVANAPAISAQTAPGNTLAAANSFWWPLITAAAVLAWLVTLALYLRLRRRLPAAPATSADNTSIDEKEAFRELREACRKNNAAAARQALLHWARTFYADETLRTGDQLVRRSGSDALRRELQIMDNQLFGARADSGEWNGETLLQIAKELRSQPQRSAGKNPALPSLYPA